MIEKLKKINGGFVDEAGIFYETPADFLDITVLGLCGCGDLESMRRYIRDKLRQLNQKQWSKYEDLPYMFFVYWANEQGLAEHGTTVRCSWLTDKGFEILRDLNTVLEDE